MKLKLLAFAFILAFAITSFGALGASGASATIDIGLPSGTVVEGPCEAITGFGTAIPSVLAHTDTPLDPLGADCP